MQSAAGTAAATSGGAYVPNQASIDRMRKVQAQAEVHEGLPQCFLVNNFTDTERENALRRMSEASDNLLLSYADWTKMGAVNGHGQAGTWNAQRGPPYVDRLTMFVGAGVDTVGNGDLVRRIVGLKKAFGGACGLRSCKHALSGKSFIKNFDSTQFRFLYRNSCSSIVIPPLTRGAGPILNDNGVYRLHHFLKDGYNTMIVLGSTASVLFINQNVATLDGGFDLEPSWVDGPYEAQDAQRASTPFSALPVTLPGSGISVTGVKLSTLPANAISYYEAEGVSVIFEVPMGTGRILYIGYDYSEPTTPWVHALVAATMFPDYNFSAPPPHTLAGELNPPAV